ncbi:fatty-acyl-CoA synthase [Geothermobacter ehrlichii]|uniref:Fatty-acyl-CoA synthase n=1 Tax=Geothermobacter ehrlichii TaxID=213224 RepID=A0A5D3WPT2_9BACT|nr:fatty acid--CoA ligase [Geothermobacter ehrlichii]TYO99480.1 fatty-acyl-CoA synthase [Geothermobacter ehrlichii]
MPDLTIPRAESAYSYPLLIKNLLDAPVVSNPDQEIVYRDRMRYSYRTFRERVCRLANALEKLRVKPGDTVAVMDYDSHRYLECFYAVPMLGAVLHTVNVKLSPEQILYTIDHAEDDILLVHADFLPLLAQIRGRIDTVRAMVLLQDEPVSPPEGLEFAGEYEALLAEADRHYEFRDFDENIRATTFYTTGTTGLPKGVYFSQRQLVLHTLGTMAALASAPSQGRFHTGDVYMPITPMFHVHAWGVPYIATSLGVKQVYPGRYAPDVLLDLIEKEGVTFSHCVPTILHMLLNHPDIEKRDLSRWKVLIGGSALPKALCARALELGIDLYSGYGMSETCPVLTLAQVPEAELGSDNELEIRCKTGRPLPLVDLRIVDEQMRDVPADGESVGEIVVRAPWLTQGYLKDQRNSEQLWRGGYLHTGDVACRDAKGYVKITDRIKDVIKIGGEWISSLELEDLLIQHPAVAEVAVIGDPDPKWGERPLALVVPQGELDEKALVTHLKGFIDRGLMSKQALLLKVKLVEQIDKTSVGKINKRLLREKHAGRV